ncbi:MAG: ferrous iron transport protein B [Bacteroidaceae bacterium]
MRLSELNTGEKGVIVRVAGHGGFRKRIVEMGFIRGKTVEVVLNAPLKDPIEYEIIGYKISLRRAEAALVEVISEQEAALYNENVDSTASLHALLPPTEADRREEEMLKRKMEQFADERRHTIKVALVGNPNCGKTSIYNVASGSHEHVGNYSGVTVDAKAGNFKHGGYQFLLVDLPGTYSLSAYSPEEIYVRHNLIDDTPDVVINVVDSSNLERNLYLTTQLIDMNLRMVVALNIYDELEKRGDELDYTTLGLLLGVPTVPTQSRNEIGINELFDTVIRVYENNDPKLARHIHINHGTELELSINRIKTAIQKNEQIRHKYSTRFLAIKFLENDSDIEQQIYNLPNRDEIIATRYAERKRLKEVLGENSEASIVDAKYGFIQGALKETFKPHNKTQKQKTITERIDTIVTHHWAGFPLFFVILYFIFEGTFLLGAYPQQGIEWFVEHLGSFVATYMSAGPLKDMIIDGIIGGVGSVIVFLPNILILYCFISLMEDSGYMARAAFIMDKVMHKMGLHGKSFIPMIMGFGCNVPAIMATRTIENHKSRLITMLVTPLMSCSARLPIYIIFIGAFFPKQASLVMLCLYSLGILLAVVVARIFSHFMIKGDNLPFVMELPPYRIPTSKSVIRHTWEKGEQYLRKMGGVIMICSIIIWFLGYYPRYNDGNSSLRAQQENSYIGHLGRAIAPVLAPMGFDWKMSIGIVSGIGAKELAVSTLGVMYNNVETTSNTTNESQLQRALQQSTTPAAALAYMVFALIYFPCIATIVAIRNESRRWKWAFFTILYTSVLAWICSFVVFRIALFFL